MVKESFDSEDSRGERIDFSLAIPFYNEEPNVISVLEEITKALDGKGLSFEILAVNNGSSDATGDLIASMHERDKRIKPITIPVNQGYGYGILTGLEEARGEVVGYTWGDGQVSAADLVRIYEALDDEQAHIAKALRVKRKDGLFRWVQAKCYTVVFTLLFARRILDPNGCPKLFRRSAFEKIAPTSHDWLLDPEIMIKANRLKYKVVNVPVVFHKRKQARSKVRIFTAIAFFLGLLQIRFGMR